MNQKILWFLLGCLVADHWVVVTIEILCRLLSMWRVIHWWRVVRNCFRRCKVEHDLILIKNLLLNDSTLMVVLAINYRSILKHICSLITETWNKLTLQTLGLYILLLFSIGDILTKGRWRPIHIELVLIDPIDDRIVSLIVDKELLNPWSFQQGMGIASKLLPLQLLNNIPTLHQPILQILTFPATLLLHLHNLLLKIRDPLHLSLQRILQTFNLFLKLWLFP